MSVSAAGLGQLFSGSTSRPCRMKLYSLKSLPPAEGQAGLTPRGVKGRKSSRAEHFFCPNDPLLLFLSFNVKQTKQSKQTHSKCHQAPGFFTKYRRRSRQGLQRKQADENASLDRSWNHRIGLVGKDSKPLT